MKYIYIVLALFISSVTFSQTDAKAKAILDKVAKEYQSYKAVSIDFVLIMENAQEDIKESSKGKAWAKGKMYKVNLMGVETYYDGTNKWSYMVDAEEVNLTSPDPSDKNAFNPSQLFTEYQNGYKLKFVEEVFKNIYQIVRYGKDGNDYTITLSKITKQSTLPDTMFKYDKTKHPDVELIDLRD